MRPVLFVLQEILNQAIELYKLKSEAETERQSLVNYANRYGLSDLRTIEQSEKLQWLLKKFAELEKSTLLPQNGSYDLRECIHEKTKNPLRYHIG